MTGATSLSVLHHSPPGRAYISLLWCYIGLLRRIAGGRGRGNSLREGKSREKAGIRVPGSKVNGE